MLPFPENIALHHIEAEIMTTPPFEPPFQTISPDFAQAIAEFNKGGGRAGSASSATGAGKSPPTQAGGDAALFFLTVPYGEKDEAKALGAKWHVASKKWYVAADKDRELFKRWWPKS